MAAEVVGTAFVRIRALTTNLAKDIERGVDKGAKDANVDAAGATVGDNFARAAGEKIKTGMADAVNDSTKNIDRKVDVDGGRRLGDRLGEGIKNGLSSSMDDGFLRKIRTRLVNTLGLNEKGGARAGNSFGRGLRGALLKAAVVFSPALLGAGSALLQYFVALTAQVGLLATAAVGAGVALGGAFGAGLLAVLPIMLAFKRETPALKRFQERAKAVGDAWGEVGAATQETLLPGLTRAMNLTKKIIPIFRGYGREVGRVVAGQAEYLAAILASEEGQRRLRSITQQSVGPLETMGSIGIRLGDIFSRLFEASLPLAQQLLTAIDTMLTRWQGLLSSAAESGALALTLQVWYDRAVLVGTALGDLFSAIWNIIQVGGNSAVPFFTNFATWAAEFDAWTGSLEGQNRLAQIFDDALLVAHEFNGLIVDIGRRIGAGVFAPGGNEGIIGFIRMLREDVVPFLDTTFRTLIEELGPSLQVFGEAFGDFLTAMAETGGLEVTIELLAGLFNVLSLLLMIPGMDKFLGFMLGLAGALRILKALRIGPMLTLLWTAFSALAGLMPVLGSGVVAILSPFALAAALIAAVAGAAYLLYRNWDTVKAAFDATVRFLKDPMKRLERLGELLQDLGDWLKEKFADGLKIAGRALGDFGRMIKEKVEDAIGTALEFLSGLPGQIGGALAGLGSAVLEALSGLGGWLVDAFADASTAVLAALPGIVLGIVEFFALLPFRIITGLLGLGIDLIELFIEVFVGLGVWLVQTGFPTVVGFFTELPGQIIDALASFGGLLLDVFTGAIEGVVGFLTDAIPAVWQFFIDLPGQIAGFLADVVPVIGNTFRDAMSGALKWVTDGVSDIASAIVGFIWSIPGYATDIYNGMLTLGGNIWQGIKDGITGVAGFVSEVVGNITGAVTKAIKSFMNSVVGMLEDAVQIHIDTPLFDFDYKLNVPGFPLRLADGGIFDRATQATIGEAGREVVIPLTRPRRALELFEQSGLAQVLAQARRERSSTAHSSAGAVAGSVTTINQTFNEKVNPTLMASELAWILS